MSWFPRFGKRRREPREPRPFYKQKDPIPPDTTAQFPRIDPDRHATGSHIRSAATTAPVTTSKHAVSTAPIIPTHWIDTTPVESTDQPCTISALDVNVHVSGLYASVTETITITNPNRRDISVDIAIPMPDRAIVCGYALDIDGQIIDGVVVPKEKARVAFETEQRRGADPGLVEAVKGNVYQTRVYPVPGLKTRMVKLRYIAPLLVENGDAAFLDAPMPTLHLDERSIRIEVERLDCPAPELSGVLGAQFEEVGTCWCVESHERDITPSESVRVALPKLPDSFALVERDADGTLWFSASERIGSEQPSSFGSDAIPPSISTLTVVWDTSGSRAAVDHKAELELIRAYGAGDTIENYRLIAFGNHVEPVQTFENVEELVKHIEALRYDGGSDFCALAQSLGTLLSNAQVNDTQANDAQAHAAQAHDTHASAAQAGAVQTHNAQRKEGFEKANRTANEREACVLFTDGLDTLSGEALAFPHGITIAAIVTGSQRDMESLRQACGGCAFDLAVAPKTAEALARALFFPQLLTGVKGEGALDILGIGSGNDGRLTVVGRLDDTPASSPATAQANKPAASAAASASASADASASASASASAATSASASADEPDSAASEPTGETDGTTGKTTHLASGPAASPATPESTPVTIAFENTGTTFTLDATAAREGATISLAWAADRVSQLSPRSDDHADELLELGRQFGVVSPTTSLLVLETLDQWLRYDIEPPKTWARMHEEWERHREGVMKVSSEDGMKADHLAALKREWSLLLEWWNRDFSAEQTQGGGPGGDGSLFCHNCGAQLIDNAAFCHRCGSPIPRSQTADIYGGAAGAMPYGAPAPGGPAPSGITISSTSPMLGAFQTSAGLAPNATGRMQPIPDDTTWEAGAARTNARVSESSAMFGGIPAARGEELDLFMSEDAAPLYSMNAMAESAPRFVEDTLEDGATFGTLAEPSDGSPVSGASVQVQAWMPDAPYLKALDEAFENAQHNDATATQDDPTAARATAAARDATATTATRDAYFQQRDQHRNAPSFFIDCAGWFMAHDDAAFGLQVLSNLAELRIEDAALLRVFAWRMREAGELDRALVALRRVLKLRPEDSQSHRDIALVLDELARKAYDAGNKDLAKERAEEAGTFYREIALTPWQRRALSIATFAVEEYNVLRAWVDAQKWENASAPELESLGDELEGVLDCDMRITLAWDADETDVDLHVTEPTGEEAYYGHRLTHDGGRVSEDITDGYGPELYEIRRAREGEYLIRAHYFASHQQAIFGPASCTLTIYTDWGRPTQTQQVTSTRLEKEKEMIRVGTITR